jgi:hypothetical protein
LEEALTAWIVSRAGKSYGRVLARDSEHAHEQAEKMWGKGACTIKSVKEEYPTRASKKDREDG